MKINENSQKAYRAFPLVFKYSDLKAYSENTLNKMCSGLNKIIVSSLDLFIVL